MARLHLPTDTGKEFPLCGKLFARGKDVITMRPCDKLGRGRILCQPRTADNGRERQHRANKRQRRHRRPLIQRNVSSFLAQQSSFVPCPKSHVTHGFLACDLLSACWFTGNIVLASTKEGKDIPSAASCPASMTSLPPSFLCAAGGLGVPYTLVCDHRADCQDNSDESFCHYAACSQSLSTCVASKQVRDLNAVRATCLTIVTFYLQSRNLPLKPQGLLGTGRRRGGGMDSEEEGDYTPIATLSPPDCPYQPNALPLGQTGSQSREWKC